MRRILPMVILLAVALPTARAVIVRGHVTTPLGVPLAGSRIQLIQGRRSVADTLAGVDGEYEIRTSSAGRFLLLTAPSIGAVGYAPQVGRSFYAGRADLVTLDIVLNQAEITPRLSAAPTLIQTPLLQLATPVSQVAADELLTRIFPFEELRRTPAAVVVQYGEIGSPAFLYLRGAPPATVHAVIDGVEANDLGGPFDLSTLSASGIASVSSEPAIELTPGVNPLYLTGAEGGILVFRAPVAETLRPTLNYTGDAGNLGALHNEAVASLARGRTDVLVSFSRFDVSNDLSAGSYHLVTLGTDLGYHISAGTSLSLAARNDLSAAPPMSPYELFGVAPRGREAHQNLYASGTFETVTLAGWHNLLRYGLARRRAETFNYFTPATGLPITIRGANGYTASGTAAFLALPSREDAITTRDEAAWQSDYSYKPWLAALGEFRFQNERAADLLPGDRIAAERTHFSGAVGLTGEVKHRLFYESSGSVDHTALLGLNGGLRLGVTYAAVRPGVRKFRGTTIHAAAATGSREPSLLEEASNLQRLETPQSRTIDVSVDQNILAKKLTVSAGYFHAQYSHEFEAVGLSSIASQPVLSQTLALRNQGVEARIRYQPFPRVRLEAGDTYLAALTEQSAVSPTFNPNVPAVPIGALSALQGQRPFHRPPQAAFFLAEYSGSRLNVALKGSAVSKSDDSTNLLQSPTLLLPNRNLSPGYTTLDANVSYAATRHITVISQLTNLTDNRHLAPIGFVSSPFLIRAGLRIRLGLE